MRLGVILGTLLVFTVGVAVLLQLDAEVARPVVAVAAVCGLFAIVMMMWQWLKALKGLREAAQQEDLAAAAARKAARATGAKRSHKKLRKG